MIHRAFKPKTCLLFFYPDWKEGEIIENQKSG